MGNLLECPEDKYPIKSGSRRFHNDKIIEGNQEVLCGNKLEIKENTTISGNVVIEKGGTLFVKQGVKLTIEGTFKNRGEADIVGNLDVKRSEMSWDQLAGGHSAIGRQA